MHITDKEVMHIQDRLNEEMLAIRKCRIYADRITDPQAKELCHKIASKHQQHYDKLLGRLKADL